MTRIAIRGFIGKVKQFDEEYDDTAPIEQIAHRHLRALLDLPGGDMHMIEVEFLDEPNPLQRYFRFGTDPDMMVMPRAVEFED